MDVLEQFGRDKRDKAFFRVLKPWLGGSEVSDIEVALNLSSMLTHCLIEIKEKAKANPEVVPELFDGLGVLDQNTMIGYLIDGSASLEEVREYYRDRFGDVFDLG